MPVLFRSTRYPLKFVKMVAQGKIYHVVTKIAIKILRLLLLAPLLTLGSQ